MCAHAPRTDRREATVLWNHIRLHTGWVDLAHLRRWLIRQLSSQRIPLISPWVTDSVCRTNPAGVSVRWSRSGSCGVESWSVISSLSAWLCAVVVFTFIFHFAYERVGGRCVFVCTLFTSAHMCIPRRLAVLPQRWSARGGTNLLWDVGVGFGYQEA